MKWKPGRINEDCRYDNLCLVSNKRFKFDIYLIRYQFGYYMPTHRDEVKKGKHYRLNILLWGEDNFHGFVIWKWWRFNLFRADEQHGVFLLLKKRMILSIGWVR